MVTLKKAKPQATLPPVDPSTTVALETDDTAVDTQNIVESRHHTPSSASKYL